MEKPAEIDRVSSPTTVYLRRNIKEVELKQENTEEVVKTWQYEEAEMTTEEYENMTLMQKVITENTAGIVESVTQFRKEEVIDEYTMQLMEEGSL